MLVKYEDPAKSHQDSGPGWSFVSKPSHLQNCHYSDYEAIDGLDNAISIRTLNSWIAAGKMKTPYDDMKISEIADISRLRYKYM